MKFYRPLLACVLLAIGGHTASASSATPGLPAAAKLALELTFEDAARPGLSLLGADGAPADLLSSPGGGVGRQTRAFNNLNASSGMGGNNQNPGMGGQAKLAQGSELLKDASSFTIQGWYRSARGLQPGNYARLLTASRLSLHFDNNEGRGLALSLNRDSLLCNDAAFRHADRWIFFAVTYDGTSSADNIAFYAGGQNEPVRLVSRLSLAAGPVGSQNPRADLVVGNTPDGARPFAGLIDNLRIWVDRGATGGVLDLAALEQVRRLDVR